MATRSKRIGGRTKSAGDSKQQGGGIRGSKKSNLKRPGTRIGPNERRTGDTLLAKEKSGAKLGPNEKAKIKSYKSKLATKPKATTTDKPKAKTTDKSTTTKPNEKKKDALKFKGKVKDFNTKPGLMDAVKKSKESGKVTGKGPVASGKEYGKTLKEHAAKKEASEKAAWLKKTRNSPAAKSRDNRGRPTWTDDERWEIQKRHRAWKASRNKKK